MFCIHSVFALSGICSFIYMIIPLFFYNVKNYNIVTALMIILYNFVILLRSIVKGIYYKSEIEGDDRRSLVHLIFHGVKRLLRNVLPSSLMVGFGYNTLFFTKCIINLIYKVGFEYKTFINIMKGFAKANLFLFIFWIIDSFNLIAVFYTIRSELDHNIRFTETSNGNLDDFSFHLIKRSSIMHLINLVSIGLHIMIIMYFFHNEILLTGGILITLITQSHMISQYAKSADVSADLIGKINHTLKEDSISNPGSLCDMVGDFASDIGIQNISLKIKLSFIMLVYFFIARELNVASFIFIYVYDFIVQLIFALSLTHFSEMYINTDTYRNHILLKGGIIVSVLSIVGFFQSDMIMMLITLGIYGAFIGIVPYVLWYFVHPSENSPVIKIYNRIQIYGLPLSLFYAMGYAIMGTVTVYSLMGLLHGCTYLLPINYKIQRLILISTQMSSLLLLMPVDYIGAMFDIVNGVLELTDSAYNKEDEIKFDTIGNSVKCIYKLMSEIVTILIMIDTTFMTRLFYRTSSVLQVGQIGIYLSSLSILVPFWTLYLFADSITYGLEMCAYSLKSGNFLSTNKTQTLEENISMPTYNTLIDTFVESSISTAISRYYPFIIMFMPIIICLSLNERLFSFVFDAYSVLYNARITIMPFAIMFCIMGSMFDNIKKHCEMQICRQDSYAISIKNDVVILDMIGDPLKDISPRLQDHIVFLVFSIILL